MDLVERVNSVKDVRNRSDPMGFHLPFVIVCLSTPIPPPPTSLHLHPPPIISTHLPPPPREHFLYRFRSSSHYLGLGNVPLTEQVCHTKFTRLLCNVMNILVAMTALALYAKHGQDTEDENFLRHGSLQQSESESEGVLGAIDRGWLTKRLIRSVGICVMVVPVVSIGGVKLTTLYTDYMTKR